MTGPSKKGKNTNATLKPRIVKLETQVNLMSNALQQQAAVITNLTQVCLAAIAMEKILTHKGFITEADYSIADELMKVSDGTSQNEDQEPRVADTTESAETTEK